MKAELFSSLFDLWTQKESENFEGGKRRYLHFDSKINFPAKIPFFKSYLLNAHKSVPKHSFYPFIKSDIISTRLKTLKTDKGKVLSKSIKRRPIAYASHFDSYLYSWYASYITYLYEDSAKGKGYYDCVSAYIKKEKKNNVHFAKEVFDFVSLKLSSSGGCAVLTLDISSFFDCLDHDLLKKRWGELLGSVKLPDDHWTVFKSVTNYTYVEKEMVDMIFPLPPGRDYIIDRYCTPEQFREYLAKDNFIQKNSFYNKICDSPNYGKTCGIPQGSPLSACLSNVYMMDFDEVINNLAKSVGGLYRRYCDDIIFVCSTDKLEEIKEIIVNELKLNELPINKDKTVVSFFKTISPEKNVCHNQGNNNNKLQYLGFEFDGNNIYIRSASMSKYARRMHQQINKAIKKAHDSSDNLTPTKIFRKRLYQKLTEHGSRNFTTYAKKAGVKILNSHTVQSQYKHSVKKVENIINIKLAHSPQQPDLEQNSQSKN